MNSRAVLLAWLMAIAFAVLVLVGLTRFERQWWSEPDRLPQAPVVIIGSSLMLHAFPEQSPAKWPVDDRLTYVRFAISGIDEAQTLDLLSLVLKRPSELVLVEINPIAFDFAFQRQAQDSWAASILMPFNELRQFSAEARRGFRVLVAGLGGAASIVQKMTSSAPLDQRFHVDADDLARLYPLFLRAPRETGRLRRLIAKAQEQGIEIVLSVPPRSATAASYIGRQAALQAQEHFAILAEELGVRLFQPEFAWPDRFFNDQAHLNRAGALRFQEELTTWWRKRR